MTDTVADVALVVSLIALVVALGQISQQFLGTAEGYRRCKAEVIGAWAARTHRKWHWYEFRYETKYTVPEIDLLTPQQYYDAFQRFQRRKKGPYLLNSSSKKFAAEEIYYTLHPRKSDQSGLDSDNELLVSWIPFLRKLHDIYKQYQGRKLGEPCCARPDRALRGERFYNRFQQQTHRFATNVHHKVHQLTQSQKGRENSMTSLDPKFANTQLTTEEQEFEARSIDGENDHLTSVVITYRELSWDFMPPDVVRPLARTHLGPLVVMSMRLGMAWQELNPRDGSIRASGNGYSLNATLIRGLGAVVQFAPDLGTCRSNEIIPTKAADKMMCGILPGCAELGIRDYPLIGDNRRVSNVSDLLTDLHVPRDAITDMSNPDLSKRQAWWEHNIRRPPFNDGVALLCPFMPLGQEQDPQGTAISFAIQFPGWLGMEPCSTFFFYEARMIFLSEITKRVKSSPTPEACRIKFRYVQQKLGLLERDFPNYFWGHYLGLAEKPCPRAHAREQVKTRKDLIYVCREIFDGTTSYFREIHNGRPNRPPLAYKQLVGAHISFGKRAAFWVRDDQGYPAKGSLYRDKFGEWPRPEDVDPEKWNVVVGAKTVADVAWAYVDRKWDFIAELRGRVGETGIKDVLPYTDEEIEEMWWMLVLRGLCWALPIRVDIPAEPVPSSYYGNRMPIWNI